MASKGNVRRHSGNQASNPKKSSGSKGSSGSKSSPSAGSSTSISQSSSSKSQSRKRERGWLLTLFLILIIGSGILQAVLYVAQRQQTSELSAPILLALAIVHAVLNVIAGVGIWFWKRWGIYLYLISSVLGVIIGVIAVGPIAFFSMLLPAIILGYLVSAKWAWFD